MLRTCTPAHLTPHSTLPRTEYHASYVQRVSHCTTTPTNLLTFEPTQLQTLRHTHRHGHTPAPKTKAELKAAVDSCVSAHTQEFDCKKYGSRFYAPTADWDVSHVTDMSSLFAKVKSFNADISNWDVSSVANMESLFAAGPYHDTSFNGDISKWDVSRVINMASMFNGATSFNADISKWDVSSVTGMTSMFDRAAAFNGDISKWDVSSVTNMESMFKDAKSFAQTLCGTHWMDSKATKDNMFEGSSGGFCFGQ